MFVCAAFVWYDLAVVCVVCVWCMYVYLRLFFVSVCAGKGLLLAAEMVINGA